MAATCLWGRQAWIIFFFRCWFANGKHGDGGMARSGIGCCVAAAMGRHCRSRAISILQHIAKMTEAPGPIRCSFHHDCYQTVWCKRLLPISCRVVIASSREMPDTPTGCYRPLIPQLVHSGFPLTLCGIDELWIPHGRTSPLRKKNLVTKTILNNNSFQPCILRAFSMLLSLALPSFCFLHGFHAEPRNYPGLRDWHRLRSFTGDLLLLKRSVLGAFVNVYYFDSSFILVVIVLLHSGEFSHRVHV